MKCSPGSKVASNKIALYLRNKINCDLIDSEKSTHFRNNYKNIIIVNGPYLYCGFKKQLESFLSRHTSANIYWVSNEYAKSAWMSSSVAKIIGSRFTLLANHENFRRVKNHKFIDWNKLTFNPTKTEVTNKTNGVFYWGSYRPDREKKFKEYFSKGLGYDVTISPSSIKHEEKWLKLNPEINFIYSEDIIKTASRFQFTVYMRDDRQPEGFAPANRFYESLSAKTLMLIDNACEAELLKHNKDIGPLVLKKNSESVLSQLKNYEALLDHQNKICNDRNFRSELDLETDKIIKEGDL